MTTYYFETALIDDDWRENIAMTIDEKGEITAISAQAEAPQADEKISGIVIPGLSNVHSHSFQRAMAGLGELQASDDDDFWSWRRIMYAFLSQLTPDDIHSISAMLYMEMLKAGYTSVAEFHYLHNDVDGSAYAELGELTVQIMEAAKKAGIALTHLPVLYMTAGVRGEALNKYQMRFYKTPEQLISLIDFARAYAKDDPQITVGMAFHSIRAVPVEAMQVCLAEAGNHPIHIHVSEQQKEVNDAVAYLKARPVEWLLHNADIDERWCLIHATHLADDEITGIVNSRAVVGLCPTTEGNLGDGYFPFLEYQKLGGRYAFGTDSHISIDAREEMRLFEYGHRLRTQRRVITDGALGGHVGANLWRNGVMGGAQAMGRQSHSLTVGQRADFLVLDGEHPALIGRKKHEILDSFIFANHGNPIKHVFSGGKWVVKDFNHKFEQEILDNYRKTVSNLARQ